MKVKRLKKSVPDRRSLKKIIRSGKLFNPVRFSNLSSGIAMKLQNSPEYCFILAMQRFHQRAQNLLLAFQELREVRKLKKTPQYMKPQLFYAEMICLEEYCRASGDEQKDLQKMRQKFKTIRKKLPKGLRRKIPPSENSGSILQLVS